MGKSRQSRTTRASVDDGRQRDQTGDGDSNIRQLAENLFADHIVAFEVTSVLLVIAVVGTVLLARRPGKAAPVRQPGEPAEEPVHP